MEDQELLELLEIFDSKVRRIVALSHELVAHPVYPYTPDRQKMAESFLTVQNSLVSSLRTSIGQLDVGIDGMAKKLAYFELERENVPGNIPLN